MNESLPRVLCVDDEPLLLEALERILRADFEVDTAVGGEPALARLDAGSEYVAVVSDMRMPGMDGAALLSEFARRAPDTTRVLLTGHAEVDAAARAVNDGKIFRFLTKPCEAAVLRAVLRQAKEQHRLVRAEKELLERTLAGAVAVLTDVLGLTSPQLFTRTTAVRRIVRCLAEQLGLQNAWKLDMAAMLSWLGCVAVPQETLERYFNGQPPVRDDERLLASHPEVAWRLLSQIPRLDEVAEIVRRQQQPPDAKASHEVRQGASILKLALEFDRRLLSGEPVAQVRMTMFANEGAHPPELLKLLRDYTPEKEEITRSVKVGELRPGMTLVEEVRAGDGKVLVAKGFEVSHVLIERLKRFSEGVGVVEPLWVRLRVAAQE